MGRRALTLALAAGSCTVCAGARRVQVLVLEHPQDFGPTACPQHAVDTCLPVVHLPIRRDVPREASA